MECNIIFLVIAGQLYGSAALKSALHHLLNQRSGHCAPYKSCWDTKVWRCLIVMTMIPGLIYSGSSGHGAPFPCLSIAS
jgi:hypothetical protein